MYNKYVTITDVEANHTGYFFASNAVWNSHADRAVYPDNHGGAYFVTSESMDIDDPRLYTVRYIDAEGDIRTVGEFMGYGTVQDAREAADAFSEQ